MFTVGQCMQMCPREEVLLREKEGLLHLLEVAHGTEKQKRPKADLRRIVKSFSRSAAGNNLANPDLLRPANVLLDTVKYLLSDVVNNKQFKLSYTYDFIADRLRSIGQDMVIQSLPSVDRIRILEPIVKFHVVYGYRLCEEELRNFDPVLNNKQLREYLKQLLVCYDDIQDEYSHLEIIDSMQALGLQNSNSTEHNEISKNQSNKRQNRLEIEAIYILSNVGTIEPLTRYLNLPNYLKKGTLNLAFKISICHIQRNFIRELKLIHELPALCMCAAVLHLPEIRRYGMEIMSHAFNSASLTYPLDNFMKCFLYETVTNVTDDCRFYGISIKNNQQISFIKSSFKSNSGTLPPKKVLILEDLLSQTRIENILFI